MHIQENEVLDLDERKKSFVIWIDYLFGIFNFYLSLNLGILIFNIPVIAILILTLSVFLFVGLNSTFFKNNPYYLYFCYSLVISGTFVAITCINIISLSNTNKYVQIMTLITRIAIIPEIIYLYKLVKIPGVINTLAKFKYMDHFAADQAYNAVKLRKYWEDRNPEDIKKQQIHKIILESKYKNKLILAINFSISCVFIILFFICLNLLLSIKY
ncbi:MAG: hypothetical protein ACFFD5_01995 [Candidatus Thorarchaeota archaeon]